MKLAWVCDYCNRLMISDSKEHHKMDKCPCGNCGVDLEEHYCRYLAKDIKKPRIIGRFKDGDKWRYCRK